MSAGWDRYQRSVASRVVVANVIGGVLSFGTGALVSATPDYSGASEIDAVAMLVYVIVVAPFAMTVAANSVRGVDAWLQGGGPASVEQRRAWVRAPMRQALFSLLWWLPAALLFGGLTSTVDEQPVASGLQTLATILLGGFTAAAIVFLLVERCLKPVLARVFSLDPPHGRDTVLLQWRLLLAWALGSAIPLLIVALTFVGTAPERKPHLRLTIWVLTGVALVAGAIVTRGTARSISEPLNEIRDALARVDRDELDTRIAVSDGSEIGLLQNGYNQMVAGLRDRRELADLFGRHVGTDVARLAREQGVRLGGEHREASVIFIDLVGSTELAQSRSAVQIVTLLNAFFTTVVDCIEQEGGWINKFEGDAALCVFGAPAMQPDHATRVLRAARRLRHDLLTLNAIHPELRAGVGVSSGEVAAGNIGDARRYEYTVIGDPVNEAARLTDEAKQRTGGVLASGQAIASAAPEEQLQWVFSHELVLRGRSQPTLAYEPRHELGVEEPDLTRDIPQRAL
jgi:adenylate cyclase